MYASDILPGILQNFRSVTTSEQDHMSVLWKGDNGFARAGNNGFARANLQVDICGRYCRSAVGKKCRSVAQAAECIQDHRSEIGIGLIKHDILSSDILQDILKNCRSAKQSIRNGQDRIKTWRIITISCNDANESRWKNQYQRAN